MTATNIGYVHDVWNYITGCDRISGGCLNCYAMAMAKRLRAMGSEKYQTDGDPRTSGPGFGVAVHADALDIPLRWRKPRRVFVNSMSDVGHARVPRFALVQMWAVMALAHRHDFLVLTKRPKHLASILASPDFAREVAERAAEIYARNPNLPGTRHAMTGWMCDPSAKPDTNLRCPPWPLPNVWVGTSIESNEYCWRATELRKAPAAVRYLSLEPLLGPLPSLDLAQIDWVIVGGESGHRYRPLDLAWVRDIRDRCIDQQIPLYFKQVGGVTSTAGGRLLDGRTWDDYPATGTRADLAITRA